MLSDSITGITSMMSVLQESVNKHFASKSLDFVGLREDFLILFAINCHLGGHLVRILILFGYKLMCSVRFQLHSNNLRKKMGLRHCFPYHTIFLLELTSILDAILDISKCSMMPEWHHSDFSRTIYVLPESTKKKSLKLSSRSPLKFA